MEIFRKLREAVVGPSPPDDALYWKTEDILQLLGSTAHRETLPPLFQQYLAQFLLFYLHQRPGSISQNHVESLRQAVRMDEMGFYHRLRSLCEGTIEKHITQLRKERRGFLKRIFSSAEENKNADEEVTKDLLYRKPAGKIIYHLEDMTSMAWELLEETLREKA